jgi:glycosyltransferase involved in cell wall biosynthesis
MKQQPRILAFATKGSQTNEELRLRSLLAHTGAQFIPYDKAAKRRSFIHVLGQVFRQRPDLLVMEGTGLAGGLVCLLARLAGRTRYVVSSGDAVGPFVAAHSALAGPAFAVYERLLCRFCDGFIGWTPYLTGRAMTFGAPRAMTASGWAPAPLNATDAAEARCAIRRQLGIAPNALVFGLAGALNWNPRRGYCYGLELVEAALKVDRPDTCVLIVGGGSGLAKLRERSGSSLGRTIFLPGMVSMEEVSRYLAAMDVASLPQSVDGVGNFRYTTKISEYAAAGLPIVTGRLPLAYDLDDGSMWRLPGRAPWSGNYINALADLMRQMSVPTLVAAKSRVRRQRREFDADIQVQRVTKFMTELLDDLATASPAPRRNKAAVSMASVSEKFQQPALSELSHDGPGRN